MNQQTPIADVPVRGVRRIRSQAPTVRFDPWSREADQRIARSRAMMVVCELCPRRCGAHRLGGDIGVCRAGADLTLASWNRHFGEEPPISGRQGSGTIFLSGCSLRCIYCQNYPISQLNTGRPVQVDEMIDVMLTLQLQGAHNINFVTPTHHTAGLIAAVIGARRRGLSIPIVWNTSGYERVESLQLLEGLVDIYLADMRYADPSAGRRYSKVNDYPAVNRHAIMEMHRQVGELKCDGDGVAQRGLLVRHLVLPGGVSGSREIFRFLAGSVSPGTAVSVMSQYFPTYRAVDDPRLNRRLRPEEYEAALEAFSEAGLTDGYCQDL